ncbi:MAG TPA: methionyl-tRNA formyltransferase [Bacillota bacterium]|nr:methionyl-tRNA formyltransferase [Bacillota bacterium]
MKRIVFMGTPDFAVPVLKTMIDSLYEVVLVVTQPDRPVGRKRILTPPPVKVEAEKHNIPIFQPEKIRKDYEAIKEAQPDLIVTTAYGQILPKELLDIPRLGCVNVHASLLPELRGGAPIHYAILEGKETTGVTIMYMVEQLDAGDMLAKKEVDIEHTDNVGTLHNKLSEVGATLLKETLPHIFNETIKAEKQEKEQATYAPNIDRDVEKIDWKKDSIEIYNHIRGLCPWPVAFTTLNGKTVKLWKAQIVDKQVGSVPGEIVRHTDDQTVIVTCGDGKGIELIKIQPSGSRKMTTEEYLRGSSDRLPVGETFDSD